MGVKRKQHSAQFKAQVAMAAMSGRRPPNLQMRAGCQYSMRCVEACLNSSISRARSGDPLRSFFMYIIDQPDTL